MQHRDYALYGSGDPAAYAIADYARIVAAVRADAALAPMLTMVTPVLTFGGIAGNFDVGASRTILAVGVIVEDLNVMAAWNEYGFPGAPEIMPLTGTAPDSAVIGTGVARVLQLCAPLHVEQCPAPPARPEAVGADLPGDISALAAGDGAGPGTGAPQPPKDRAEIEVLAASANGAPNVARLKVVKAVNEGVKELDDVFVAMHLPQAQRLLFGSRAPEVTAILLQLHSTNEIPAAEARLEEVLRTTFKDQPLTVRDFRDLNPYYGQTIKLFDAIFGFIAVLIGGIVLFTVVNTMNAAVVERTVEIGTLRAIGLRRAGIRALFITEGMLLGAFGALAGIAAALLLAAIINHSGLTWTPPGRVVAVALHLRVWEARPLLLATALAIVAVSVVSAWWPARRAARQQVVEALRHV
jgi:putative ABC transport system permease protein